MSSSVTGKFSPLTPTPTLRPFAASDIIRPRSVGNVYPRPKKTSGFPKTRRRVIEPTRRYRARRRRRTAGGRALPFRRRRRTERPPMYTNPNRRRRGRVKNRRIGVRKGRIRHTTLVRRYTVRTDKPARRDAGRPRRSPRASENRRVAHRAGLGSSPTASAAGRS